MTKKNNKYISFLLACLMICAPFMYNFIVGAESVGYTEFVATETAKSYDHPEYFIGSKAIFNIDAVHTSYQFINVVDGAMQRGSVFVHRDDLVADDGKGIVVKIVDYFFQDTALYFKVEAAEGYTLPESVASHPYTLQYFSKGEEPSLLMLPRQAMFVGETVVIKTKPEAASKFVEVNANQFPIFIDVEPVVSEQGTDREWNGYDIGDIYDSTYRYVDESSVLLVPIEVVISYEKLLNTTTKEEYEEVLESIPQDTLDQFTDYHKQKIDEHVNLFIPKEVTEAYEKLMDTENADTFYEVLELIPESVLNQFTPSQKSDIENHLNELVPAVVRNAYESLMNTTTVAQYNSLSSSISREISDQFIRKYVTDAYHHYEQLVENETVEITTKVDIDGVNMPISVKGLLPEDAILSVKKVTSDVAEEFGLDEEQTILAALDIKIFHNEEEWQPQVGESVLVSFGVDVFGYEDDAILEINHKHGETISKQSISVVKDGKVYYKTTGFSVYVVNEVNGGRPANATRLSQDKTVELEVSNSMVLYASDLEGFENNTKGTWSVTDTSGAIYYTVHVDNSNSNYDTIHEGDFAPYIEIIALKETTSPITLSFSYANVSTVSGNAQIDWDSELRTETYTLNIIPPKVDKGEIELYLKDDVNKTGRIIATLIDSDGNIDYEGLLGASFSWTRSDELFITPQAYGDNKTDENTDEKTIVKNSSINIAMDHAGLVEARKNKDGTYKLVRYDLKVILANGEELYADYTVYYQSEILNANFEVPNVTNSNYTFLVNGSEGLFWKTTAPGQNANITRDIEVGDVTNGTANANNGTDFGLKYAADGIPNSGGTGVQFTELNAEAFGALYQDIITAPGEDIDWSFSHAPRRNQSWATNISNAMFIIIGATEDAQKLTSQAQLEELGRQAKGTNNENLATLNAGGSVEVEYDGAKYKVWYHNAGTYAQNATDPYTQSKNYGWTKLSGSYSTPNNQYRTRLFFVSDKYANPNNLSNNQNTGNLIDAAKAGQYKSYLVEYYEETFDDGNKTLKYLDNYETKDKNGNVHVVKDEKGESLIYSSVKLECLKYLTDEANDYLQKILINGQNAPYDIRYGGTAAIYIQKYPGKATPLDNVENYPKAEATEKYKNYDIVVQIVVRDTVIAIQKEVILPSKMTIEQKLDLFSGIEGGYQTSNLIYSYKNDDSTQDKVYLEKGENNDVVPNVIVIQQPDPSGKYTGYVSHDNNPDLGFHYYVEETSTSDLTGLELKQVNFIVTRYKYGAEDEPSQTTYQIILDNGTEAAKVPIVSPGIYLSNPETIIENGIEKEVEGTGYKIAEVKIQNIYKEKETIIHYKAVGNGKLKFVDDDDFEDYPTEELDFYSEKAQGCRIFAGQGASFKGWYKDEACTQKVTDVDGVVYDDGSFKPNANILAADEVTFYAKFETNSIVIERTGAPGQTFIYHITGTGSIDSSVTQKNLDMYVSVTCDETGYGKTEVFEIVNKTITVKETEPWSWRYEDGKVDRIPTQTQSYDKDDITLTFAFGNENAAKLTNEYWINHYDIPVKNEYIIPEEETDE